MTSERAAPPGAASREPVALAAALALCTLGVALFLLPATRTGGSAYEQVRGFGDWAFPLFLAAGGAVSAGSTSRFAWAAGLVVAGSFLGWLTVEAAFGLALHPTLAGLDLVSALGATWDCVAPFAIGVLIGVAARALPRWLGRSAR